jgi:RNA polymerase sigma factor (sigma-70 family)
MRGLTANEFKKMNALMLASAYKVQFNEDLAQEAVSRVWVKFAEGAFDKYNETELLPMLRKAARNQVIDIFRMKYNKLQKTGNIISLEFFSDIYSRDSETSYDEEIDNQLNNLLLEIEKLKPNEAKLIRLRYIDGLSYKKIAKIMRDNEKHLCVRAGRILKKIQLKMSA